MNIFYIDQSPERAARMLIDAHIVKMPLESAQMLCTAAHKMGLSGAVKIPFRPTHENHPCVVWLTQSKGNVLWLERHYKQLLAEFTKRFGHKMEGLTKHSDAMGALCQQLRMRIQEEDFTTPALAMPEWYKLFYEDGEEVNAVWSYRSYYHNEKMKIIMGKAQSAYARTNSGSPPPFAHQLSSDPYCRVTLEVEGQPTRSVFMEGFRTRHHHVGSDIPTIRVTGTGSRKEVLWIKRDGTHAERSILVNNRVVERTVY